MAKARPTRGQFPRGMKGDVMFRNALKKYKESMGPKPESTPSSTKRPNRSERRSGTKPQPAKPQPRRLSNIPPSEGTGGAAEKKLGYGAGKAKPSGGGGGGKPKTDSRNKAYQAARDKIAKAQGKEAKAKATTNAEIVGLTAFIKAHEKKKGMAKAVAAAKASLARKQGKSKPEAPASKKGSSSPASSVKFTEEEKKKAQPFLSKSERTKQAQGK